MEDDKDTKYCENCEKHISQHNFLIHSVHCQRNLEVCKICKETVPKKEMKEHIDEMHMYVSCDNCHQDIQKWKLDEHNELSCEKRPILCKYCDLTFPLDQIEEHISYCGSRTEKCPKCQKFVPLKDQEEHELSNCNATANSQMKDEKPKTAATPFNATNLSSPSEIFWGMNAVVTNKPIRTEKPKIFKTTDRETNTYQRPRLILPSGVHQFVRSPSSSVTIPCKYCGLPILRESYNEHQKTCPHRTKECPNCHKFIAISNIKIHNELCKKDQQNSIPEAIKDPENRPKLSCYTMPCGYCDTPILDEEYKGHMKRCLQRKKECPHCYKLIAMAVYKSHVENCPEKGFTELSNSVVEKFSPTRPCRYCDTPIFDGRYKEHLKKCVERKRECPNCHVYIAMTDYKIHAQTCDKDQRDQNRLREQENHLLEKFSLTMPCEYCDTAILHGRYREHLQKCKNRKKECPKCSERITMCAYKIHVRLCTGNNQGSSLQQGFSEFEASSSITSDLNCVNCDTHVPYKLYGEHISKCKGEMKECPYCYKSYTVHALQDHLQFCSKDYDIQNQKDVEATGMNVELESASGNMTSNISELSDTVPCENCGKSILIQRYSEHTDFCLQERECPYCLQFFPTDAFLNHVDRCFDNQRNQNQQGNYSDIGAMGENLKFASTSVNMTSSKSEAFKLDDSISTIYSPSTVSLPALFQRDLHSMNFNPESYQSSDDELLPCEFCGEKFRPDEIIQHGTGCNPEVTSLPSPLNNDTSHHSMQFDVSSNETKNSKKQVKNMCINSSYHNLKNVRKTKGNFEATFPNRQNDDQHSHSVEFNAVPNGTESIKNQMEDVSIKNCGKPKNVQSSDISSWNPLKNDISRNQVFPHTEKLIKCTFCDKELPLNNLELHKNSCKKIKFSTSSITKHNIEDSMDFQSPNNYLSGAKSKSEAKNAKQIFHHGKPNRTHSLYEGHRAMEPNKIRDNRTPNFVNRCQSFRPSFSASKSNTTDTRHSSEMKTTPTGRSWTTSRWNNRATTPNQRSVKSCRTDEPCQEKEDKDLTGVTYCPFCKMEYKISDVDHHIITCNPVQLFSARNFSKGSPKDRTPK